MTTDQAAYQALDYLVAERDNLSRQQEILSDIAFNCGLAWNDCGEGICAAIMEELQGSRGLMDKFKEWAREFDSWWESLEQDAPQRENYIEVIDTFSSDKFNALVATVRLEM